MRIINVILAKPRQLPEGAARRERRREEEELILTEITVTD